jgi:multiple sugar transport system substrate-binding protein
MMKKAVLLLAAVTAVCALSGCQSQEPEQQAGFVPQLDTNAEASLTIVGDNINLPAIVQVIDDFNLYYPNCTILYEGLQNYDETLPRRLINHDNVDLFMITREELQDYPILQEYALDLGGVVDLSNYTSTIADHLTMYNEKTGQDELLTAPLGLNCYGLFVNRTLLEEQGLQVPENLSELEADCDALVQAGYTPLQWCNDALCYDLMRDLYLVNEATDGTWEADMAQIADKADGCGELLRENFELLVSFLDKGYLDPESNSYNLSDYALVIESFLRGEIPFLVGDASLLSSIAKRESTVQEFVDQPFDYGFIGMPLREDGAFAYMEPWQGLSVNPESDWLDYAKEFVRFATQADELNVFTSIKTMPSASADQPEIEAYDALLQIDPARFITQSNLSIAKNFDATYRSVITDLGAGRLTVDEAVEAFEERLG